MICWLYNFEENVIRCSLGFLISVVCSFFIFPKILCFFQKKRIEQVERDESIIKDLAKLHNSKIGTPTFGGILILLSVVLPILLFVKFNFYTVIALVVSLLFGLLGFVDDWLKLSKKNIQGIRGKYKLIIEGILTLALLVAMYCKYSNKLLLMLSPILNISHITYLSLFLLWVFMFFVLTGTSNAVNLTDGLDGLASVALMPNFLFFLILALISSSECLALIFNVHYLPGINELAVLFSCFIGGLAGFLWYNSYPANIIMGDTGSLMLGSLLGVGALLLMKPFFLIITGLVFVIEALSDILQVGSFKFRHGKRIFLMAPIHHHFELLGISEQKIVTRTRLISICMFVVAILILIVC